MGARRCGEGATQLNGCVRVVTLEAMGSGCFPSPWKVRPA